jgi:tetratricopeptide (TPR) repeat protein
LAREAETSFQAGRYEDARQKWSAALGDGASRAEGRLWRPALGRAYEAEGNFQKALASFQEAYDADPNEIDRMVDLARLYDAVEMDDQAIRFYTEAHQRDHDRRDVSLALARLHKQGGRLTEARGLAEAAVRAEPRDFSAQELLAEIEEAQGNLGDASRRRESIVSQRPTAEGYMKLGHLWARQDAYEQADIAFSRAEQAGSSGPEAHFEQAVLAWRQGDRPRAALFLEQTEKMAPGYFPAGFLGVLVALEAGEPLRAEARLDPLAAPDAEARKWRDILEAGIAGAVAGGNP